LLPRTEGAEVCQHLARNDLPAPVAGKITLTIAHRISQKPPGP